jgi:hypothetical protein
MPGKIPNHDGGDIIMQIDEKELEDIDLDKLEDAFNRKELQSIPVEQLRKVHKVFIDSTTGATSRLGVHLEPDPDPKWNQKESKRRGRKSAQQLIKEVGNFMINSGKIQCLSEGFFHPPHN